MKTWHNHTFARRHRRSFAFSISADRKYFALDVAIGRHSWSFELGVVIRRLTGNCHCRPT